VEEPANANPEDEGPIEDNVGIDIDETMWVMTSTCLIQMLHNIIVLMRILCVLWIFMIQEIGIILITKQGIH
jgi:hypothetical protein